MLHKEYEPFIILGVFALSVFIINRIGYFVMKADDKKCRIQCEKYKRNIIIYNIMYL